MTDRQPQHASARPRCGTSTRAVLAIAVVSTSLGACKAPSERGSGVDQLNDLRGATQDLVVELREGTNMAAAPSPDGQRIVFSAQGALWVMPIGGGRAVRITDWHLEPTAPAWSPDGRTIAFQNYAPEGNYHIWTVEPDGHRPTEITTGPNDDREPAWLPNASGLVFSSDRSSDGQYKIWSVALGGAPVQMTVGPGAESNPVVSADGARLAYVDGPNVMTMSLAGGAPTVVGPGSAPAWTPDGSALVYQNAARQLVVGGFQVTRNEDVFPFPVRFLPDGRFLYTADGKIRIRNAAGAHPSEVGFQAELLLRRPVFTHVKDHGFDNLAPRQAIGISAPALSPDGRSVAFVALNDVWTMRIGQVPVRLTHDVDRDGSPQWTADGSAVYFSSERGNGGQLAIDQVTLADGVRTRLAAVPGRSMVTPKMSPTGDRIAYTSLSGQLEIWHRAAGTFEVIAPSVSTQVSTPSWTPDGSRIMLVDNERINNRFREGYNKLRVIHLATRDAVFHAVAGAPRQISQRDEGAAVLSPDGTRVAFIMDSLLHVLEVADIEIDKARRLGADYLKSYVRAPIPITHRIAQGALEQGLPSGTHLRSPGAAAGIAGSTHLSATQRMGYGWSKSFARAITCQDTAALYGAGDFRLVDTLFSAGALARLDPGIVTDPRFILVPPNFVDGLQHAQPPSVAQLAAIANDAAQQAKVFAAGALLANGSDTPLVVPGIGLHLNLRAAGAVLGNYTALQTVTINAAQMAFVGRDLGSIEPGKLADLIAVRGNPLADLRAAADVRYVIKNGRAWTQAEILGPFRSAEALAARERGLEAWRKLCGEEPGHCGEGAGHAH